MHILVDLLIVCSSISAVPEVSDNPAESDRGTLSTILTIAEVVLTALVELLQSGGREAVGVVVLDDLVGVHDDGDEQGEDNVDEEAYEGVEVDSAVDPN